MQNSNSLVLKPQAYLANPNNLETTLNMAEIFAESGFFADSKGASQCVVKIMAGAELGFGPIAAMTGIYFESSIIPSNIVMSSSTDISGTNYSE